MKAGKHLTTLIVLAISAAAQTPNNAVVESVTAARAGNDLRVEIRLTKPVTPSVETAFGPDRILIDLPGTTCNNKSKKLSVDANGVRRVRTAQHSTTPMITRVVIDLDRSHPYTLKMDGTRIILTVGPAESAGKIRQGPPPAATSGSLLAVFKRKAESRASISAEDNTPYIPSPAPPPPVTGPSFEPPTESSSASIPAPPPPIAEAAATSAAPPSAPSSAAAQGSQSAAPVVGVGANPAGTPATSISLNKAAEAAKGDPSPIAASMATSTVADTVANPNDTAAERSTLATTSAAETGGPAKTNVEGANGAAEGAASGIASAPPAASAPPIIARSDDPSLHTVFKVKYVAEGVAYLDGGRSQGLTEGMKLEIKDSNLTARQGESVNTADPTIVAELVVSGVAETSAVTEIHTPKRAVKVGDLAYLSSSDAEALVQQRALSATRQYPAVISFTEGDTLDEEVRQEIPRPPLPSVNRARGRIGFDTIETFSHGTSSVTSTDMGVVFRGDITRIGGTYWNLSGYWRGELTKESALAQQTLQETLNRTYHLNITYDNPNSEIVAGFGRFYLPWAPSLDTIDGGYFGLHLSKGSTVGIFGGSTPDPASWDYNPSQAISGAFVNFEGGEYNGFHYSTTTGAGLSMIHWASNDPFLFFEENVSYKRTFAIYESAQIDSPKGNTQTPAPGVGLGQNFFTLRINPHPRIELDANYNYFRQIPTFDPTLVGTGLLDKYLFQGFSAGGRVEVFKQIWISTNLGRSSGTGDAKSSLNEMYGITFNRLPKLNLRADLHYSRFNSSFGTGYYDALSLSRQVNDRLRLELLVGEQNFASAITANTRSRFVTGTVETTIGPHYYLQSNFTTNRGDMSYDQVMFSMGYRFDSKRKGE
jgi:hypothetical protein